MINCVIKIVKSNILGSFYSANVVFIASGSGVTDE
jgi:hypothetical protein